MYAQQLYSLQNEVIESTYETSLREESKSGEMSEEKERLTNYEDKKDKVLIQNEQTNDQVLTNGIPSFLPLERHPFKQTNK